MEPYRVYSVYFRLSPRHKWELNSNQAVYGEWTDERASSRARFLANLFLLQATAHGQAEAQAGVTFSEVEHMNDIPYKLPASAPMGWVAGAQ